MVREEASLNRPRRPIIRHFHGIYFPQPWAAAVWRSADLFHWLCQPWVKLPLLGAKTSREPLDLRALKLSPRAEVSSYESSFPADRIARDLQGSPTEIIFILAVRERIAKKSKSYGTERIEAVFLNMVTTWCFNSKVLHNLEFILLI